MRTGWIHTHTATSQTDIRREKERNDETRKTQNHKKTLESVTMTRALNAMFLSLGGPGPLSRCVMQKLSSSWAISDDVVPELRYSVG